MANTIQIQTTLLRETIVRLWQEATFMNLSNRQFEEALKNKGIVDQGKSVTFRLPNHFPVVDDSKFVAALGDVTERLEEVKIAYTANNKQVFNTDEIQFETAHDFENRFVIPIASDIGMTIDSLLAKELFRQSYHFIGTAGVQPDAYEDISDTMGFMNRLAIPKEQRALVFHETTRSKIMKFSNFQNSFDVARTKLVNSRAMMGETCLFTLYSSPLSYEHIAGVGNTADTPASGIVDCGDVKTAPAAGIDQLAIKGLAPTTSGALKVGDKIYIEGRYVYSYAHKKILTDVPVQFTILPDSTGSNPNYNISAEHYNSDVSGDTTVTVSPNINGLDVVTAPEYANIDTQPAVDDTIKLITANTGALSVTKVPYKANMAFVPTALLFAAPIPADLEKMANVRSDSIFAREQGMNFGMMHYAQGNTTTVAIPNVTHRYRVQYGFRVLGEYSTVLLG